MLDVRLEELSSETGTVRCVLAREGDVVTVGAVLANVDTNKVDLDVLAPVAGRVAFVGVKERDEVDAKRVLFRLEAVETVALVEAPGPSPEPPPKRSPVSPVVAASPVGTTAYAGPSVRKKARELGIDLSRVPGTGPRGRIREEDLRAFVEAPPEPSHDFAAFGEVEVRPLSRVRLVTGRRLVDAARQVPQVTQFDHADVTDLEAFRVELNAGREQRLTLLPFVIKACVNALATFPEFNASLAGENLIVKRYLNIGVATETPEGLMVPVIRGADRLGVRELGRAIAVLTDKARTKCLSLEDTRGSCFTVSSLGGIGGTAFTPLVNPPEVAILGISRHSYRPRWDGSAFQPRLVLPLSLSYDHRVIDGGAAARFVTHLGHLLADIRHALL
jgi:pyruvate dehydrogenase E2 component (dihydrolipoamide acetyltransferase)